MSIVTLTKRLGNSTPHCHIYVRGKLLHRYRVAIVFGKSGRLGRTSRENVRTSHHHCPLVMIKILTIPRAWPRGTQVTLCSGIEPSVYSATSAWPPWQSSVSENISFKKGGTDFVVCSHLLLLLCNHCAFSLSTHEDAVLGLAIVSDGHILGSGTHFRPFEVFQLDSRSTLLRRLDRCLAEISMSSMCHWL